MVAGARWGLNIVWSNVDFCYWSTMLNAYIGDAGLQNFDYDISSDVLLVVLKAVLTSSVTFSNINVC